MTNSIAPVATQPLQPITCLEFLQQNASPDDPSPQKVAFLLDQLLAHQPVRYTSILDAIPLLRTFLPTTGIATDYALLIGDKSIVGFVWLGSDSYKEATSVNARLLMRAILALNIKSVVLASTYSVRASAFDQVRTCDIDVIGDSFYQFGVSLNDWLHIHPTHTESYMLAAHGEESIHLTEEQIRSCYDQCTFPDHSDEEVLDLSSEQAIVLPALVVDRQPVQVASPLSRSQEMAQLDMLLLNGQITDNQHSWSSILPVPDNSMAPALVLGGYLVAYLLDPKEYASRIGKVVTVQLTTSPNTYQIGRLKSIDGQSLTLAYDKADVDDLILPLGDIRQLCEGIHSYGNPVL